MENFVASSDLYLCAFVIFSYFFEWTLIISIVVIWKVLFAFCTWSWVLHQIFYKQISGDFNAHPSPSPPLFPPLFAWGRTFRQTSLSLSLSLPFPLFSTGIAFPHIQRKQKRHISVRVSLFLSSTVFFLFCLRGNLLRSCLMFFVSSSLGSWAIIRPCKNPRVSDFWALMKRFANHKGFPSSQKKP